MAMMKMIIYIKDAHDTATTTTISMIPTTKKDLRFQHSHLNERSHSSENKIHSNFMEKKYLQIHGTAMGTKVAVAFANIFTTEVETVN